MMGPLQWLQEIRIRERVRDLVDDLGITYREARARAWREENERDYEEWRAAVDRGRRERDAL